MNLLGIHLTLLVGPTVPVPAPVKLTEALSSVEVTHKDSGPSGFQLTFKVGRGAPWNILDYPLVKHPLLRPFNRVILLVRFKIAPEVLMDGFITRVELSPSDEPGGSTLTITGEDVSVMMDLEEKKEIRVGDEATRVRLILLNYLQYLLSLPDVRPTTPSIFPSPTETIPHQAGTDRAYINSLAQRYSFVFYVKPGFFPGQNFAYWGPSERVGLPQPALSTNMGPHTNVNQISFTYDALKPAIVVDTVQDSLTDFVLPVIAPISTLVPPLASQPSPLFNLPNVKEKKLNLTAPQEDAESVPPVGGMTIVQAYGKAFSMVNTAAKEVVTATGELDALRYGHILQSRGLVGVRGAGFTYDGLYYVKSVTHSIKRGEYTQKFTLTREGTGTTLPMVRP